MNFLKTVGAWGLLLTVVFLGGWSLIANDMEQIGLEKEILLRKEQLLARLHSLPAQEAAMREQLQSLSGSASEKYLYRGDRRNTQTLMQRDLRQIASHLNIRIGSMRTLGNSSDLNRLSIASVQTNLVLTNEQLLDLLAAIEARQPLLRVQRMSVRIQRPSSESENANLAVMLEVAGYHTSEAGNS